MKRIILFYFLLLVSIQTVTSQTVAINFDKTSPQQRYAALRLENALKEKGYKSSVRLQHFKLIFHCRLILVQSPFQ
jgi:hypothetical protein